MSVHPTNGFRRLMHSASFLAVVACSPALQAQQIASPKESSRLPATPSPQTLPLSTQPSSEAMLQAFSALKQPVALLCRDETLSDVLTDLHKQSGVALKVTPAWVGDLPVTAYTNKMPLGQMMQRLARLYDLSWRQETLALSNATQTVPVAASSVPDLSTAVFVLYESPVNQRDIARLRRLSWDPLRLRVARIREYAAFTPEQLMQMAREGDAQAKELLDPITHAKVAILAVVDDEMLEALIDKETRTFSFAQLPAYSQDAMRSVIDKQNERLFASWQSGREQGADQTPFVKVTPEEFSVSYVVNGEGSSANLNFTIQGKYQLLKDSAMGATGGDGKVWWREWYARGQQTVPRAQSVEVRKVPSNTLFGMTEWSAALRLMHDKWQVNVFSDAYPEVPAMDKLSESRPETEKAGEGLSDGLTRSSLWGRKWWQEGEAGTDILFLRTDWYNWRDDGNWYTLSLRLKQLQAQNEVPTLEDLARVAGLASPRLYAVRGKTPINGRWSDADRDILRLYTGLNYTEKRRLWSGGLAMSTLSLTLQRRLLQAVQSRNARATEEWLRGAPLCLKVEKGVSELYFKVEAGNSPLALCRWQINAVPAALAIPKGGGSSDTPGK